VWAPVASTFLDKLPYVVHRHPRFGKIIQYFLPARVGKKAAMTTAFARRN
jgi:hypothetical protein